MLPLSPPLAHNHAQFHAELKHLRSGWCWLLCFGILLIVCGTVAVVVPAATLRASILVMIVLGTVLMISGLATIVTGIWAGRWSGLLPQLLCGILYLVAGYMISDAPLRSAAMAAAFFAALFVLLGAFRILTSLLIRYPFWGWSLLNGIITLLCGIIIYRHFARSAIWVVGLLVGLEMIFHGWNWVMIALAIRNMPETIEER
ncbi:MAG TPA: DUF308 domain-containing protein [Pirellulales bacterium]|jgi:uncharacterized membrane protein HdeD (DUF308 family)|nr:DUF308 domain-containing protein [Pirellulales bacterium]